MTKISRRKFLLATVPAAVSLYISGWWFFKVRNSDATDIVIQILKNNLSYLKLKDEDLATFAESLQQTLTGNIRQQISWAGIMRPIYSQVNIFSLSSLTRSTFAEFEEYVISKFLLSTDFFINNADENRNITYLGFYPYERPCSNPFARLT
jgi:hypothetical protein